MTNEIIGMILSLCGMFVTIFSFQAREKKGLLILQSIGTAFYLVSYIFADGGVAIWLNALFLIRNFVYIAVGDREKRSRLIACGAFYAAYFAVYIVFVLLAGKPLSDCLWSLLPIAGGLFGTAALVNVNVNRLRLLKIADSCSWLCYNSHIGLGALGGILGEIFNIFSILIALFRFSEKRTGTKQH